MKLAVNAPSVYPPTPAICAVPVLPRLLHRSI